MAIQHYTSNRLINTTYVPYLMALIGIVAAVGVGVMTPQEPLLVVLVLAVLVASLIGLNYYPETATLGFLFILFTNAATIAVKFHNLPFFVGAAFPLLLLLPFAHYLILKRQPLVFTPLVFLLVTLLLVEILATLNSISIETASSALMTFVIEGLVIYFLLVNTIRSRRALRRSMLVVLLATIVLGVFPLFQQVTKTFDNNYWGFAQVEGRGFTVQETLVQEVTQPRLAGAIGEKNRFAQIMLMLAVIAFSQILVKGSRRWRLLALIATGFAAVGSILAFSRGAAVGFALMLVVAAFLRLISVRQIIALLAASLFLLLLFPQYTARLLSLQSLTAGGNIAQQGDGATQGRITEMLAALTVYAEHPVIGVGPGMNKYFSQEAGNQLGIKRLTTTRRAHNLYLDIASDIGTLGLVLYLSIMVLTIWQLIKIRQRLLNNDPLLANTSMGLALSIIVFMTTGIFLHFAYIRYFWTIMGLAGATIQIANNLAPKPVLRLTARSAQTRLTLREGTPRSSDSALVLHAEGTESKVGVNGYNRKHEKAHPIAPAPGVSGKAKV